MGQFYQAVLWPNDPQCCLGYTVSHEKSYQKGDLSIFAKMSPGKFLLRLFSACPNPICHNGDVIKEKLPFLLHVVEGQNSSFHDPLSFEHSFCEMLE